MFFKFQTVRQNCSAPKWFFFLSYTAGCPRLSKICFLSYTAGCPRWRREWQAPAKLCSFSYVLFVFLLFYVLDIVRHAFKHCFLRRATQTGLWVLECLVHRHSIRALCLGCATEEMPLTPKKREESCRSCQTETPLSDILFQPFCWLTFSHWITNSANCGRASHTNEKQGTAALFASQKPGCLQWFQTQPSSSRASPCIAQTERKSSQGKAEVGAFVSISTTRGVMKGTYTLLNPSAPLIWNFICFCVDHSGYRGNLQRS